MRAIQRPARVKAALSLCLFACVASALAHGDTGPGQAKTPRTSTDGMRMSDAEKTYVPAQATTRVAEGPRQTSLRQPAHDQLLRAPGPRVDEAGATVVPVTGAGFRPGDSTEFKPRDGAAARAYFDHIDGMCFSPDGTLYLLDEHLVRKLDRGGQESTWAF